MDKIEIWCNEAEYALFRKAKKQQELKQSVDCSNGEFLRFLVDYYLHNEAKGQ